MSVSCNTQVSYRNVVFYSVVKLHLKINTIISNIFSLSPQVYLKLTVFEKNILRTNISHARRQKADLLVHFQLRDKIAKVWLLVYDFYHRSFDKREPKDAETAVNLFEKSDLHYVEAAVWTYRVKLAAAIARLRIKNSALSLNELLPKHLKNDRIMGRASTSPITCWINIKKVK